MSYSKHHHDEYQSISVLTFFYLTFLNSMIHKDKLRQTIIAEVEHTFLQYGNFQD